MGIPFVEIAILSIIVLSSSSKAMANFETSLGGPLECKIMDYEDTIIRYDRMGRKCWDTINIRICGGYCSSSVKPLLRFPYKRYNHPVCIHSSRVNTVVTLKHCDEGVAPGTERHEYISAGDCKCSICNSSDTSCEGARKRGPPSPPEVQETDDSMSRVETPAKTMGRIWTGVNLPYLPLPIYP